MSEAKIKKLSEIRAALDKERAAGRKIAHCHGVFDLVHPGHIVHLKQARKSADILVVTVTPDRFVNKGPGRPVFHEGLRVETLAAIEYVDYVVLNESPTATAAIRQVRPDFYIKGSDYADPQRDLTGKIGEEERAVKECGGSLYFTDGFTSSSSELINRFFNAYPMETQKYLKRIAADHGSDKIIASLDDLRSLKILVVGETILDQYTYANPVGKPTKSPIVSTVYESQEHFGGGALATANHAAAFCETVTLLSATGENDWERRFLKSKLRSNVRMEALITTDRPTVRKRRFIESTFMTKMFEIQYLVDTPIGEEEERQFLASLNREIPLHDLIIVNDFGHGLITPAARKLLSGCGKFLALNTQANSANLGYNTVTRYDRADYVAIDEPELRLATRDKYGEIPTLAAALQKKLGTRIFLVSRGGNGTIAHTDDGWVSAPALATKVVDRVGAGDTLFAATSPCAYKRMPPDLLCFIGNCVGAMAVGVVGNRESIEQVALYKFIQTLLK
ncbi:MAG: hypothetical protein AUJ52_12420 [Elusimicrobia bacterium CG1_02_63_36]|nr:MAG: hypothetical protein AUJ52_12420 [Elusimicrobia bacterium CG1_02_63_36]PIP82999.1 MAG: cytidyltransferase [Elusimicrobia bacterium CG22_combo_CG10-13_8_21_14_all_63_91]PJA17492.1 MAG: cytidyltransferase [Elusimicrobia bacterium CG_4_10_14_0_2_um_filter_63_34]PJB25436.1 MAG: cytidyltransferase [Elusimicrobia bacterium CG_4_9_14_3_um_filter_62_55]